MTTPGFSPMSIPPQPFPESTKRWYRRWYLWLLAGGVALGALIYR